MTELRFETKQLNFGVNLCSSLCSIASLGFLLPKLYRTSILFKQFTSSKFHLGSFVMVTFHSNRFSDSILCIDFVLLCIYSSTLLLPQLIITGFYFLLPSQFDAPLTRTSLKHITQTLSKNYNIWHLQNTAIYKFICFLSFCGCLLFFSYKSY